MRRADPRQSIRLRTTLVGVAILVFLAMVGGKAVHLHVYRGTWLSQRAASEYEKSLTSTGKRGTIFDANLGELALTVDVTSVGAYPSAMADTGDTAAALAGAINVEPNELRKTLSGGRGFVWIKRHVPPKEATAVKKLDLKGIAFVDERSRFYPYKHLASQVLGFSGIDGNGLEGIEYYFDQRLKGPENSLKVHKDALGRRFDAEKERFNRNTGDNLVLTIDRRIQYVTEKALEEAVNTHEARSGMAVVLSPETGAVLALAHYPFFNPNNFGDYDRERWRNRGITDPFEPGSTMKIFSAAAALEHGGYTENSVFYCENGSYRIGRNVVHDTKKHGWLSLAQIVKYSSNIGAVKIGEMVGSERLYRTLRDFGFGTKTGIECPGETGGSLAPFRRWTKIDAGTIAFGQGVSASAIQLAAATAAIANDGVLMKPYVVQAVTNANGKLLEHFGPRTVRRVVSVATARAVSRMMQSVITQEGTGRLAALDGYTACGKTGTAQKIGENGLYAKGKFVSSFVGFAPAENPKVVVLVVVDEPDKQHYGGTVAAPAFKQITQGTLHYLNVSPKGDTTAQNPDDRSKVSS